MIVENLQYIDSILPLALSVGALGMALTKNQRGAILYRDNRTCQMDCEAARFCGGLQDSLEVHHTKPQHYMKTRGHDPDYPENLITLCSTFHQKEVHGVSQSEVLDAIRHGEIYWNPTHDEYLSAVAEDRTRKAEIERRWKFPQKNATVTVYESSSV